jgi:hypothetical protein
MTSFRVELTSRDEFRGLSSRTGSKSLHLWAALADGFAYLTRTGEQVQQCICETLRTFDDDTLARHGIAPQQIPHLAATRAGILPPAPAETRRSRTKPPTEEIQSKAAA